MIYKMILGIFDYILFFILITVNIIFWRKKVVWSTMLVLIVVFFVILFPITSSGIELERIKKNDGMMDNFEGLYVYLKFPIYWMCGIFQILLLLTYKFLNKNL